MNKKKWWIAGVLLPLTVLMAAVALPVSAQTEGACGDQLTWFFDEETATLTIGGKGEMEDYSKPMDFPWYEIRQDVEKIVIEKNVTSLSKYAFSGCEALTEIEFRAANMKDLPDPGNLFYGAGEGSGGYTLTVGANVTRIPARLFYNNGSSAYLTGVVFQSGSACREIGDYAFGVCELLEEIDLPDGIRKIGEGAFSFTPITKINLGNKITEIGDFAFTNTQLIEVTIPDGVKVIGKEVFQGCGELTSVKLGKNVEAIGDYAFSLCESLTALTLPSKLKTIGEHAFEECFGLTEMTIPDSVTSIGEYAFVDCRNLTQVKLGKGLTSLGDSAFIGCSQLKAVEIPESLTELPNQAFSQCTKLKEIVIPDTVTKIGSYAFYGCTALNTVTIGKGVKYIYDSAFADCTALTTVYFNATEMQDSVYMVEFNGFAGSGTKGTGIELVVGANVTRIPRSLFCPDIFPVKITERLKLVSVRFAEGSVCREIADYAFGWCPSLTEVTLPDSLEIIGDDAFAATSITSIAIPHGVTQMGNGAFSGCKKLATVYVTAPVLAEQMTNREGCAGLIEYAQTVWIGSDITDTPDYLTTAYRYVYGAAQDGVAYTVYSKLPCTEEHEHIFKDEWASNENGHGHPCVSCDAVDELLPHEYEGACQTTCRDCGSIREPRHSYYYPCDSVCTLCGVTRDVSHTYDNDCDPDCHYCKQVRTVTHTYGEEWCEDGDSHWKECEVCGVQGELAPHAWDEGTVTRQPTESDEGERVYTCLCGESKTEAVAKLNASNGAEDGGLSVVTVTLIAVAAGLIAGLAVAALFLKKKKTDGN